MLLCHSDRSDTSVVGRLTNDSAAANMAASPASQMPDTATVKLMRRVGMEGSRWLISFV